MRKCVRIDRAGRVAPQLTCGDFRRRAGRLSTIARRRDANLAALRRMTMAGRRLPQRRHSTAAHA
jgi:hypothetical protein